MRTQDLKLEEISSRIPDVIYDIRYATTNNVTGKKLYDEARAQSVRAAAEVLTKAANELRRMGLRLVIFDAYRTLEAQNELRKACDDINYVDPDSNHCKGLAVDLTLAEASGTYLDMGTEFDDFSEKAHDGSKLISEIQEGNRQILKQAMEKVGYNVHPYEWWHFDYGTKTVVK